MYWDWDLLGEIRKYEGKITNFDQIDRITEIKAIGGWQIQLLKLVYTHLILEHILELIRLIHWDWD